MAFVDQLPKDGRALMWLLEVSTDNFSSVSYRWATHSGFVSSAFYEARIVEIGDITRGFGQDHLPVASTVDIVLDNTDFVADFLVDHATMESFTFGARFRLSIGLSDDTADTYQATILKQTVGVFVCLDFPRRDDGHVYLSLADDSIGQLSDLIVPPSPADWLAAWNATTENSACFGNTGLQDPKPLVEWTLPTPIQFTGDFSAVPLCTFNVTRTPADFDTVFFPVGRRPYIYPILVLASRDDAVVTDEDVQALFGTFRTDVIEGPPEYRGSTLVIPELFTPGQNGNTVRIWKAYKTDTISLPGPDGATYDWKLLWIAFDVGAYAYWMDGITSITGTGVIHNKTIPAAPEFAGSSQPTNTGGLQVPSPQRCNSYFAAFASFSVSGRPGSAITDISEPANEGHPANVIQDLVSYYSVMGASAIDATRFDRVRKRSFRTVRGSVSPDGSHIDSTGQQLLSTVSSAYGMGTLRRAIAEVAGTSDIDVFMTMAGKAAIVAQFADFDTQTGPFTALDEEKLANVTDRVPSAGERWAPYNRVFLTAGTGQLGPYDDPAAIQTWKRIIAKTLPVKWDELYQLNPNYLLGDVSVVWATRNLEAKVRPIISFTTDVTILALELGDYFTLTWARGGNNSVYPATLFRIESMVIGAMKGTVEVSAVWMGDLQVDQPFLLDNESLALRVAGSGGRTCTVTDVSDLVDFSSGDIIADGVVNGDFLLIRDSSEAATTFFRNKMLRIVDATLGATQIQVDGDLDFGTAGSHVIAAADWSIVRSFITYPNTIDDPANYPSGSEMYGKVSDGNGQFSDSSAANKLLDG